MSVIETLVKAAPLLLSALNNNPRGADVLVRLCLIGLAAYAIHHLIGLVAFTIYWLR